MNNYFAIDEIKSVAYVSPEAGPFAKTGGLGDVAGELPQALALLGIKTYIFTIGYNSILEKYNLDDTGLIVNVPIDFREVPVKILSKQEQNVTYYFLVAQPYTDAPYQGDKLHLTILLSEGTLKAIEVLVNQNLMLNPQVIHVNDWQTGLIPVFIKTKYDKHTLFSKTATVLTVHNQGHRADWIPGSRFPELGIGGEHWFGLVQRDNPNYFCILRGAIFHADKMNAVSKTNRDELLTDQYGGILANDFRERNDDIVGIMNGVDYEVWKPVKIEDKSREKSHLQSSLGFDVNPEVPLIGMVSRIAKQKNVQWVVEVIRDLLIEGEKIQFVFLGKGNEDDPYNHDTLELMHKVESDPRCLKNVKFIIPDHDPNTKEQKEVFVGIELFPYPSEYEPCGTKPIVALISASPGVVRKTGGLADNFKEYDKNTGEGNGFVFEVNDEEEFRMAMKRAIELFKDKKHWQKIVKNAQNQDRSWKYPAMEYVELYKQALQKKASYTSFVKPFGNNKFVRYENLKETFIDNLEYELKLSEEIEISAKNNSNTDTSNLLERLRGALDFLKANIPESTKYYERLKPKNSCCASIKIKVSDNLPNDAVSYHKCGQQEIIFSKSFIDDVLGFPQCTVNIMLAIRLFHELGHTCYTSFYKYLREEYELIKDDAQLYRIILEKYPKGVCSFYPESDKEIEDKFTDKSTKPFDTEAAIKELYKRDALLHRIILGNYPNEVSSFYPKSYEGIMKGFTNDLITDFDDVVKTIEEMEEEARNVYNDKEKIDIDNPSILVARRNRIQCAFDVADPESPKSKLSTRLKSQTFFKGTFLESYLTILGHRGIACGRESFFFLGEKEHCLEEKKRVFVVPFEQLKNPRVGNKENERWARQYYALHDLLYMSDGLAFTEAENGRGYQQKFHEHESQEQTISLCDNTQLRYAHHELPERTRTRIDAREVTIMGEPERITKEFVDEGEDKDKEVIEPVRGGKKYVIYDKDVPFATMINMPKNTFHTLNNTSEKVPSIDFTIKDPITQLIKNYDPNPEGKLNEPEVKSGKPERYQWGEIYKHDYGTYNRLMSRDNGEMAYDVFNDEVGPIPIMYDKIELTIKMVVVNPKNLTDEFPFSHLYDEMQPIRIFPWPANIPEDDKVENSIDPAKHKWVLDRDFDKINAKFYVIYEDFYTVRDVRGGDIILLNNKIQSCGQKEIKSFIIKNTSENFKLMFFILEVKESSGDNKPEDTTLKDILM